MRPQSILKFEQFYMGSIILGLVNTFLNWSNTKAQLAADPNASMFGDGFLIVVTVISVSISLLLWYFTARKASNVCKWILTVFFVIGLIFLPFGLFQLPTTVMIISLVSTALAGYAIYMLFRPDAVAWFQGETAPSPDTFD